MATFPYRVHLSKHSNDFVKLLSDRLRSIFIYLYIDESRFKGYGGIRASEVTLNNVGKIY